jgi:hypothetical protein
VTDIAEFICRRASSMKQERAPIESVWRACYQVTYPERAQGLAGEVVDAQSAQQKKAEILDSTAPDSARMFMSQVHGGMTPANAIWVALDVGDESDEERRWLDHAAEMMWEAIHGSNFDAAAPEALLDSMCVGWFPLFIDEDTDSGKLTFDAWPIGQVYIASSKPGGMIDIVYRCFELTAEQAVSAYGDKVSPKILEDAEKMPGNKHQFILAIYPRTDKTPGSKLPKNMPIASVHVEAGSKRIVRESGYFEMPVVVPRWRTLPGSPYATGPVSDALATINELNALLALEKVALARAAAGVYVAADDGVLNPRNMRVRGGTVIVANSVDSIKELPTGANFEVTFSKANELRAEIRKLLLADQLQPQDGPAMTATEVHVRVALIRQLLGPLYGRFQAEYLAPMIDRVFGLLYRRGRPEIGGRPGQVAIDDAPETLQGERFRYRYQSPLARAQKMEEVTAIERLAIMAGMFVQQGDASAFDLIDTAECLRISGDALGAPSKALRDEKQLKAYRDSRAQAQEQQAQQEQAAMTQQTMVDAAGQRFAKAGA